MNPWGINTFWNFWKIDIRNCRRTPRRNSWRFLEGTPVVLFRINLKNVPRRFMDGVIVGTLERIYGCIPSKTRAVIARDSPGDSQNDLRAFASLAVRNPRGIPLSVVWDRNSLCNFRFYFLRNPGRNSWEHPGRYSSRNHRKNSREIPEEKKNEKVPAATSSKPPSHNETCKNSENPKGTSLEIQVGSIFSGLETKAQHRIPRNNRWNRPRLLFKPNPSNILGDIS